MNLKQCGEYKAMGCWKPELCRWCISSCPSREESYGLAGKRWSLKAATEPKIKVENGQYYWDFRFPTASPGTVTG